MTVERIYTAKLLPQCYLVRCDDGEYRHATLALTQVYGAIIAQWVEARIGRGVEDITDTAVGAALINTLNQNLAISASAAILGRKGGAVKSERKAAAVRENGKKGGRPRKDKTALK